MKWTRFAAFAIGLLAGAGFLAYVESPPNWFPGWWEVLTLLTGPLTLLAASFVGLKFERLAGWWLLSGAAATAALLVMQLAPWQPGVLALVLVPVIFCSPMVFSGLLWLAHADLHEPTGERLPMMP